MIKRFLLTILLLLALAGNGWGATWYVKVDPTNGATKICYSTTSFDAACTANSNKTFANLIAAITAGDTIELSGGESGAEYQQQLSINKVCSVRASTATGHNGMVTITPQSSTTGITINAVSNTSITGPMTVNGYNGYGLGSIMVTGTLSNVVLDSLIVNNNYAYATARGIYISATGEASTGNEIKNCTVLNTTWTASTVTAQGISLNAAHNWSVHDNIIGGENHRFKYGMLLSNSNNNLIYKNNISYSWNAVDYPSGDGQGILIQGTSTGNLFYRNILDYNYIGVGLAGTAGGNKIYYNLVKHSGVNGINLTSTNTTAEEVYNNTVIHTPSAAAGHGIAQQTGTGKIKIKNNLIYGASAQSGTNTLSVGTANAVIDVDYNLYYPTGNMTLACKDSTDCSTTLSAWQTDIAGDARFTPGKDVNSKNADPLFVNYAGGDYSLTSTSPAINAGVNVSLTTDYAGKPIKGLPDIGAYEFYSSKRICPPNWSKARCH